MQQSKIPYVVDGSETAAHPKSNLEQCPPVSVFYVQCNASNPQDVVLLSLLAQFDVTLWTSTAPATSTRSRLRTTEPDLDFLRWTCRIEHVRLFPMFGWEITEAVRGACNSLYPASIGKATPPVQLDTNSLICKLPG